MGDKEDIENINEFLQKINEIQNETGYEFLFRGQADASWGLESGYHRITNRKPDEQYTKKLIEQARKYKNDIHSDMNDIEILAKLQHIGAKTIFLDFTKNALVALYFACGKYDNKDGCVFVIRSDDKLQDISNKENIDDIFKDDVSKGNSSIDINNNDIKKYTLEDKDRQVKDKIGNDNNINLNVSLTFAQNIKNNIMYSPPFNDNRMLKQDGVLLYIKDENAIINQIIIIHNDSKGKILEELKALFNIEALSLFPDLQGFALYHE